MTWQGNDDIFFHRSQLKVGTVLVNVGRLYHGTTWKVVGVCTYKKSGNYFNTKPVQVAEHMSDKVTIVLESGQDTVRRTLTFASLSYSAIWRLR